MGRRYGNGYGVLIDRLVIHPRVEQGEAPLLPYPDGLEWTPARVDLAWADRPAEHHAGAKPWHPGHELHPTATGDTR